MPKTKPTYPDEFKREVVAYMRANGKSQRETAEHFGVSVGSLRGWERRLGAAHGSPQGGETGSVETPEQELRRLRRENRTLQMRCEILKRNGDYICRTR